MAARDPMQREGVDDSLSEASEQASTNNVSYSVSNHNANTFPTAAPYGAASMGAPQVSSWDTGNGCAQAQLPTQSCGGTFGPTGHSPLPSTLPSTPPRGNHTCHSRDLFQVAVDAGH